MSDTILLVEDGPDDRLFMARAFEQAGLSSRLQFAEDGQVAVDYLSGAGPYGDRVLHPLPRMVLLDLKLPRLPGFEVLKWIRAHPAFAALIVVILTSSDHPSDVRRAYELGANSFLSKPGSPKDLADLIRDTANYWLKKNIDCHGLGDGQPAV